MNFKLKAKYLPAGDQPKAIKQIVDFLNKGHKFITLRGITGSGKTFTLANVLEKTQRSALIISPNKTLAAQLYNEFRQFFPDSPVHFFISYYDYYRPEAYIPATDTYLEKEASINQHIDYLRHAATVSLLEEKRVIVVASVSSIYGIGAPADYLNARLTVQRGLKINRDYLVHKLANELLYKRDLDVLRRGSFRIQGEVLEILPSHSYERAYRIIFLGDEIEAIFVIDAMTKKNLTQVDVATIYPTTHFAMPSQTIRAACQSIRAELEERIRELKSQGKILEAERLESRTLYDLALLSENGTCPGIENYSRHLSGRKEGEAPITLIDYFPNDYVLIIDESHVSVPQLRGMYEGDRSRKQTLVDHGFRLPSALDNRPLKFNEILSRINQCIFVSATPGPFELSVSGKALVEIINRPTGLLDPIIEIRPATGQVQDCFKEALQEIQLGGKVLMLTITKKLAEQLSRYFREHKVRARYLHSDLNAIERYELLRALRNDEIDVIVGINLLREGLDLVEVSLVCVLDADKEGFLRSSTSLIQIIGRCARNINGRAILYADKITSAIKEAVDETNRRRKIQIEFNRLNNITPKQPIASEFTNFFLDLTNKGDSKLSFWDQCEELDELERKMFELAKAQKFEEAIILREKIKAIKQGLAILGDESN
ncbi:MAG: excinuclease ABC subunit UvrB [Deltaproteobacteria bacterium]|nr:excinuclease ABC subunit UvrB [Deltaproteobacteria bacterium]